MNDIRPRIKQAAHRHPFTLVWTGIWTATLLVSLIGKVIM